MAEVRQPLLQGAGTQFNRIAGPAQVGQYNGVMIARINTDIALANFEEAVRNLVSDVETAYWELYFEYRALDAVIAGRDSALTTWRKIYTLYLIGGKGGEAEKEAQARAQYFLFRSTAENSLNSLYVTEAKFRYLMGLAATDGRLIRPEDEPTTAKVAFDWHEMLNEGLARSVELREAEVDRQAAGIGIDRGQELPAAPARPGGPVPLAGPGQRPVRGAGRDAAATSPSRAPTRSTP